MVVSALWVTVAIAGVNEDFLEAARQGDLTAVKSFIASGVSVNAMVKNGATALMAAAWQGHKDVAEMLLAKGADVNVKAKNGVTALMLASRTATKK